MPRFGLIGLGVMGRNLALNARDHDCTVIGYDLNPDARRAFKAAEAGEMVETLEDLIAQLPAPRIVLMLVPAGAAVEEQLTQLSKLLSPGDMIVDAGNSYFRDTERRAAALADTKIGFVGLGVSGGEEGARRGPAMMAGGSSAATARLRDLLSPLAAKVSGRPCFDVFGTGGAGHFVKMVHNGIEYAVMQSLAEATFLLRHLHGMTPPQIGSLFADWNRGALGSYLTEISGQILQMSDPKTGQALIDIILDVAEQKGTGHWTVTSALELGVPVPSIVAAVEARAISAVTRYSAAPAAKRPSADICEVGDVHDALIGGIICAYAQGFSLLDVGRRTYGWDLDIAEVAQNWQGGCIIRSNLLTYIQNPYLLETATFKEMLAAGEAGWRRTVANAVAARLPLPALMAGLAYWDSLRTPRLWADMIQAQRDYFGNHGFRRIDKDGVHHMPRHSTC